MTQEKDVRLKVMEALQEEAYRGTVRIDSETMHKIGVHPGDVVSIEGGRETVGIVDRAYPTDVGQEVIRMDGILRRNAKTGIGEHVKVRKADVKEARSITIAPAQKGVMIRADPELFKRALINRAVVKDDIIVPSNTRRRRRQLPDSPLFDNDVFSIFEESFTGAFGLSGLRFIVVQTTPLKTPVLITESTNVVLNPKAVEISDEKIPEVTYEDIGGLKEEIKKIREMVELPLKHPEIFERLGIEPPKGVLLHGPPGTGKTLLAKAVANEVEANFMVVNGPEILNKFYGESEKKIRDIFDEAEKNSPTIIFFDEIDAIAPKREESYGELEKRVVSQLLAQMDGLKSRGKVIVVAATNRPNSIDPALRRPGRFDREISIGVPNKKGRLNILKIHTRNMPLANDVALLKISEITHGFVGADLSALCKEAAMNVLRRILPDLKLGEKEEIPKEILDKLVVTGKDFKEALKLVRPSAMREVLVETPNIKWEDIGGLEKLKQELKEAVNWPIKYPGMFKRIGIRAPKGILMYGPPGTGKTLLAKAVANESEANFILVKGPELLNKFVGESEKGVKKVFERARQVSPCIIFFDEIDALAPRRGLDAGNQVTERVVNTLLAEIDGLEELNDVVVIAASNRPDILDPALLRPGRFDRLLLTPPPERKGRLEIFKIHTKGMPIKISKEDIKEIEEQFKYHKINIASKMASDEPVDNSDIKKETKINFQGLPDRDKFHYYLAEKTEGYVGADIEGVCNEAGILALREDIKATEVRKKHFDEALIKVKPSISKEAMDHYTSMEETYLRNAKAGLAKEIPSYMG
ncbi:CDC48 family AAA ATPase [Candidatus Woesearchaeota archaeon]|nr:CDC48 family AAA ATPase [Candidatus Woesearchaeota archaeon]